MDDDLLAGDAAALADFLQLLGAQLGRHAMLAQLHAAYNDVRGVTAAFNKNALVRLNREFGATFNMFDAHASHSSSFASIITGDRPLACSQPRASLAVMSL